MRKNAIVALFVLAVSVSAFACGKERWPVKVLSDPDNHLIIRTVKPMTVAELAALDGPPNDQRTAKNAVNHRLGTPEETTYRVTALLLGYRKEQDGDFHLVLKDPKSDATMIAEIPDPRCITDPTLSKHADSFRKALVAKFGTPGKKTKRFPTPARIVVRGIGFFDIKHPTEQDGAAPNNLEIHPVLGLSLSGS